MKTEFVTFDHFTHEMFGCDSQRVVIHRETNPKIDAYTCISLLVTCCTPVIHYQSLLKQTMNYT